MQDLAHLSDAALIAMLAASCSERRRNTTRILAMLAQVEERRLHLAAAASSMWDYARRFLLMSHGTAYRFIAAARLCRQYPWLVERIEAGEVHLTTLAQLQSFITPENVHELVGETAGKRRTDVDLILGRRFGVHRAHGGLGNPFPWDAELLKLAERAAELASHVVSPGDRLSLSKMAYRLLIGTLEKRTRAKADRPRTPRGPTKSISRDATRTMFEAHGDQCAFVDARTGGRCPSRAFIQREHRLMRVHGGTDDAGNLRPMCGAHNRFLAEVALGRDYVSSRIRCRRRQ